MKKLFKKIKNKATMLMTMTSLGVMNFAVYAGGQTIVPETDPIKLFTNIIKYFLGLVQLGGIGVAIFGAVNFFMAFKDNDAEKKSNAMNWFIAGAGLIGISSILKAIGINV